ncbi:DNA mismatch repair protein MutL [Colletotrichum graminicola]|uniref:DNA mismatch repair protein PMS1 n=1 Tax=Colletotrichum graminicola (strain M1.001 / M2 / FGSC 10212) TaxID=645133 RepID=E3Q9L8_COLGM|nr:DNA mismatch repair protein MutL [Colletotrichum graminicola M1.001]EFQ27556.1 DNA mismatch repair protein MutL [Colletotrichum graminicola M1.001]WDK11805.1 DNA mismatch repair protein MutL [Colletotrichum graminicola]
MATIKPIEGRTVHQIQSGQVIVDLCSVVKELVENSIDAGASSIDVRFKNQGLDSIEVQDNGSGISPDNYETVALKHYTSKLSTYSDLGTLQTFGFRGEALSSLSALSQFSIVTCMDKDVPKGTKLDFESSGKLKETHVVAAQKGTNVIVENLFHNLPVRRRELQRNIKREWNKVIALLNQYACIQTGVKFSVSQQPTKGKRIVLFSTKGNPTTRENLVNIFGAKTMTVLVPLDLELGFEPTSGPALKSAVKDNQVSTEVRVQGYVSRPAHGEGRQTPDRQMFFVNGRPCGLPQFAKVFNEVYKAYNASQSPFIFADIQLDTHLYDVNVSPDKRTIMLHDQSRMLESLKEALASLFQSHDYPVPAAQQSTQKAQPSRIVAVAQNNIPDNEKGGRKPAASSTLHDGFSSEYDSEDDDQPFPRDKRRKRTRASKIRKLTPADIQSQNLISRWVGRTINDKNVAREERETPSHSRDSPANETSIKNPPALRSSDASGLENEAAGDTPSSPATPPEARSVTTKTPQQVLDFNARLAEAVDNDGTAMSPIDSSRLGTRTERKEQAQIPAITPLRAPRDGHLAPTLVPRLPKRSAPEVATVTIGESTVTGSIETTPKRTRVRSEMSSLPGLASKTTAFKPLTISATAKSSFGSHLSQMFSANQSVRHGKKSQESVTLSTQADSSIDADSDNEGSSQGNRPNGSPLDESMDDATVEKVLAPSGVLDELTNPTTNSGVESPEPSDGLAVVSTTDNGEKQDLSRQAKYADHRSNILKGGIKRKDATLQHNQDLKTDAAGLQARIHVWKAELDRATPPRSRSAMACGIEADDAEEVLSLIISKSDFAKMTIVGQFNLGFIIAVRNATRDGEGDPSGDDELFIIDQHASDEKYNFERLQSTTVVQSQRLVHPKQLELTALEEEIVMENISALDVNGFKVSVDSSGSQPVGSRCKLLALPLSRETTFTLSDLEELISLLGDHHLTEARSSAPRPSKVRSMFAMRACRSSVMIGKALAQKQMEKLIRHMGELDKPWNCPHGRPTMRHLSGLGPWDDKGWREAEPRVNWARYAQS